MRSLSSLFFNLGTVLAGGLVIAGLVSCEGIGGAVYHPDMGPFDENGDYVVALADEPVRRNQYAQSSVAQNREVERARERQLLAQNRAAEAQRKKQEQERQQLLAQRQAQLAQRQAQEAQLAQAQQRQVQEAQRQQQAQAQRQLLAQQQSARASQERVISPSPRAIRPASVSPTPARTSSSSTAPSFRRHRVTSKDTLYSLSRRYGTTVGAIQRANGLRGTTIITGSSLKVPR